MEIPSIKEELERKSVEMLAHLIHERLGGKITEAQYSTGLDVLWGVASGLAGDDFFNMISMTKVDKNDQSFKRHTMLLCREHWILITVDITALSVSVHRNGGSPPTEIICDSIAEALDKATVIQQKAGLSGYAQIN